MTCAAFLPLFFGASLIAIDPLNSGYFAIGLSTSITFAMFGFLLLFIDVFGIGSIKRAKAIWSDYTPPFKNADVLLLVVGITAFYLKMVFILDSPNPLFALPLMLDVSNAERYAKVLGTGFSVMHYLGFLGGIYLAASFKNIVGVHRIWRLVVLSIYAITLILLQKKVQIVLFLFVLMWSFYFTRTKIGSAYLLLGGICAFGLALTAYDNYRFSKDHSVMVEFVIRYGGGSLIVFDIHSKNGFWELLKFDPSYFYNYLVPLKKLGFSFTLPETTKYILQINEQGSKLNSYTVLGAVFRNFGLIFGSFFLVLSAIGATIIFRLSKRSAGLRDLFFPLIPIILSCFSISFIGNGFVKLEWPVIFVVHLFLVLSARDFKNVYG